MRSGKVPQEFLPPREGKRGSERELTVVQLKDQQHDVDVARLAGSRRKKIRKNLWDQGNSQFPTEHFHNIFTISQSRLIIFSLEPNVVYDC